MALLALSAHGVMRELKGKVIPLEVRCGLEGG